MLATDVAVVGGGPAGTAAAITLARAGRRVVLVDRAVFPRDKTCGDGLTTGALRRLEALGLPRESVPSWHDVEDVWVRSPSGRTVRFPLPRAGTYAAVARRADLDMALVELARDAGADVREGHALRGATPSGAGVVLDVEGVPGGVAARYVIGADGVWSPLRKALVRRDEGDGRYLGEWHAFRQYMVNTGPGARRLWVWFEPDFLPGYAWSFPLPGDVANVGFGILRGGRHDVGDMAALWADILRRPHIREVLGPGAVSESAHRAWPIPASPATAPLLSAVGGRALFVGDAARLADPMTGEGIGQALETGAAAARAIERAGPSDPVRAAAEYTREVQRGLATDNRLARALTRALRHRKGTRAAVRVAASNDWTRRNFARWLFEDYPRAILATPHRWHRGMLTGPGAYRGSGSGDRA